MDFFICAEALLALGPTPEERRATMEMDGVGAGTFVKILLSMQSLSVAIEDARVVVLPGDGKRDESKPLVPIARSVPGAKKTITVKGVVVDEQGAPVAHAAVVSTCGTPPVVTESGADGTFSFEAGRPFGGVHAQAPGHVASWDFAVEGKYGDTVEVRLAFRGPGSAVEGVVREVDGRETEGATVSVRPAGPAGGVLPPKGARAALPSRVTTAADGRYRVESFVPGEFEVVVQTKQGITRTEKGSAKPGETVHLDVTLPATTTWHGTLRDADGKPVAGATIQAGSRWMARTAADGSFALAGLEAGAVKARVRTRDGASIEKSVTVEPGAEFQCDLFVGGGPRIAGRVVDADGKPLADCTVALRPRAPWLPSPRESQQTGADGAFAFDELEPGSYRIAVSGRTRIACFVSAETTTGTTDVEIRVPRDAMTPATLRARIVDADGKPAAGASLSVRDVATGETTSTSADGIGTLRLESLPRGRYLIWASDGGGGWTEVGRRDLGAGADLDLGTIRLAPPRTVVLECGGAPDGVQVASYQAELRREMSDGSVVRRGFSIQLRTPGTPSHQSLPPGRYTIRVNAAGCQPIERTFDVAATGETSIALPLRAAPERRIALRFDGDAPRFARVRVLDADGLVVETKYAGSPIAVRLVPGRYRVEADVARSAIETLRGELEVPTENAPTAFDVDLR